MSLIRFSSEQFFPTLPEVVMSEEGAAGFELALFVAQALAKAGLVVTYPLEEDWCWLVQATTGTRVGLCIHCVLEAGEARLASGFSRWCLSVIATFPLLHRLRGRPVSAAVDETAQLLREALDEAGAVFE